MCFRAFVVNDSRTSISLLMRLQNRGNPKAEEDWNRFVSIYAPLILMWARNKQFQDADAMDLVQEVLIKLHRALPNFRYNPKQRFRGYLFTTTLNAARNVLRSRKNNPLSGVELDEAMCSLESDADIFAEKEFRTRSYQQAVDVMKNELPDDQWQICKRLFIDGDKTTLIAEELGINVQKVYTTKSRVLKKLREELTDLVDES